MLPSYASEETVLVYQTLLAKPEHRVLFLAAGRCGLETLDAFDGEPGGEVRATKDAADALLDVVVLHLFGDGLRPYSGGHHSPMGLVVLQRFVEAIDFDDLAPLAIEAAQRDRAEADALAAAAAAAIAARPADPLADLRKTIRG